MRILTVRQPWALHIIQSGKDVENRVRNIAGSYRGPVAIHAALKADDDARPPVTPRPTEFGAIIGVVDLVGVHHGSKAAEACFDLGDGTGWCSKWAGAGDLWHLQLANPRQLFRPIPYRGALGLRTLDPETVAQIERIGFITRESFGDTA